MNSINMLLKSPAFWTALIGVISALVMQYTGVPNEIWIQVEALLGVVAVVFTGTEFSKSLGKSFAKASFELSKKQEDFITKEDAG